MLSGIFFFSQQGRHFSDLKNEAQMIVCVSNLKQVGQSFQIWGGDHNNQYPFNSSVTNGGTMELANGKNAWINFFVMSNQLTAPKVLDCPADAKRLPPATNFSSQLIGHISYFVGLDATETDPQSILSGDDNLELGGVPAETGLLTLSSNSPVAWTPARHRGGGSIFCADGSISSLNTSRLTDWLQTIRLATNRFAIP